MQKKVLYYFVGIIVYRYILDLCYDRRQLVPLTTGRYVHLPLDRVRDGQLDRVEGTSGIEML